MDLLYYSSPDTEDYWKEHYKELNDDLGPAEGLGLPVGKMQGMRLRYAGKFSGGDLWIAPNGKKYYADPLGSGGGNEDNPVTGNVVGAGAGIGPGTGGNNWQNYLPPTVNPVSNANNPILDNSHITDKSAVLNSAKPPSNRPKQGIPPPQYGTANQDPIVNSAASVTDTAKMVTVGGFANDMYKLPSVMKRVLEDCKRPSHFYLLDKNGKDPDSDTWSYFDIMNARAGGIFKMCPDGKVLIIMDKTVEEVRGKVSQEISYVLAKTIESAIEGGVGYNRATIKHNIKIKIKKPTEKEAQWNENTWFDSFSNSTVDLSDIVNCVPAKFGRYHFGPNQPFAVELNSKIVQAAFIGHFILELSSFDLATSNNSEIGHNEYVKHHNRAITRECEIISEMSRLILNENARFAVDAQVIKDKKLIRQTYYYPLENVHQAIVINFFSRYFEASLAEEFDYKRVINTFHGTIVESEIFHDKNFKIENYESQNN